jgi:hypothetical protein|tara:strand:+ start:101 stop:1435 length:1335 start_codon:yes stop_codon:yes gene_type:complete
MKKVTFLNHASILIQSGDNIIMTDPWYKKPAFGSWLSVPPCVYHPSYFMALAKSNPNFVILISHGHDDHFDDDFLTVLPKNTTILFPKYKSPGPKKRLKKCGIKNIIEFDSKGVTHKGVTYKSYIFEDISMDDAFITVATDKFIVAHGNDNWQKLPQDVFDSVFLDFAKYKKQDTLFMSQTNMADGYPLIYTNFTEQEKKQKVKKRQDNMILTSVKNALDVNAGGFISYAGMAIPFIKGQESLLESVYCKSLDYIKSLLNQNNIPSDIVLDMVPGDSYNFEIVEKLFGKQYYNHNQIKDATIEFYRNYGWDQNCNTYQEFTPLDDNTKSKLLELFLDSFKNFVYKKFEQTNEYQKEIFNTSLTFQDKEFSRTIKFSENPEVQVTFNFDVVPLEKILLGELNWEVTHVGYESRVHINGDYHIGSLIRYLTMYGYVYQNKIIKEWK